MPRSIQLYQRRSDATRVDILAPSVLCIIHHSNEVTLLEGLCLHCLARPDVIALSQPNRTPQNDEVHDQTITTLARRGGMQNQRTHSFFPIAWRGPTKIVAGRAAGRNLEPHFGATRLGPLHKSCPAISPCCLQYVLELRGNSFSNEKHRASFA
jgi:hypothetical protein